jgi:putative addiction module CopG family antidote
MAAAIKAGGIIMSYPFPPDLERIVGQRMASGKYASEDELLRDALRALGEEEQDLIAVRDAFAEWQAGDAGIPLDAAFAGVRQQQRTGSDT